MTRDASQPVKSSASPAERVGFSRRFWHIFMRIVRRIGLTLAWIFRAILIIFVLATFALHAYPLLFVALVLVSIGFALVRTRLANFGLFVNRSLVYSLLTISLALVYFAGIASFQVIQANGDKTARDIGIVVSTVFMVVLFQPLRTRLQTIIDRRFYRSTYDAARVIAAFTATLREEIDLGQLNERLITVVRETLLPSSVTLWERATTPDEENGTLRLVQWGQNEQAAEPFALDISNDDALVASVLETTDVVDIDHIQVDSALGRALKEAGVQITLPLISRGELVGLLNLGPRLSGQKYAPGDRALLNTLSAQVAPALRVAQMVREQQEQVRERERIEQELRTAQQIQRALLPEELPRPAGWQIATYYQPAREVGGDFYDFLPFADGRLGIVIGDVAGKGVPAALVMSTTCTMLRTAAPETVSPGEVLARVNELLAARIPPGMFVTCFYAMLDPHCGRLRYANAGHEWPYQRQAGNVAELQATGMPLGMLSGSRYDEYEARLDPGESLLLYSDGLVEAHNPQRDMFGLSHLRRQVGMHTDGAQLIDALLGELAAFTGEGWEQEDDVTMVVLHRTPEALTLDEQQEQPTLLLEAAIASAPDNEQLAMEQVADAVLPLHLSPERLADLKTAVAEAVMNAMEYGNHYEPEKEVTFQVLASDSAIVVRIRDQGEGSAIPETITEPDLDAKLAEGQTPRGWGLFLIKSLVDELRISRDDHHNVVELVMYREAVKKDDQKT